MSKKSPTPYSIGLDVGITGVGWCVTDPSGKVIRRDKKHLMGTVRFDEADTAKERRLKRSERRRQARKKERIHCLQSLLEPDVLKEDADFFIRLNESAKTQSDRTEMMLYKSMPDCLFKDGTCRIRDHKNGKQHFPVWLIRNALVKEKKQADIRYVYLAIHHILKSRGHFLDEITPVQSEKDAIDKLLGFLTYIGGTPTVQQAEEMLRQAENSAAIHIDWYEENQRTWKIIRKTIELLRGAPVKLREVFLNYQDTGLISFDSEQIDAIYESMEEEDAEILADLNQVYLWINREKIKTEEFLSEKMKKLYDQHRQDLKALKEWYKKYAGEEAYRAMFHNDTEPVNYNAYVKSRTNPKAYEETSWKRCTQEAFYSRIYQDVKAAGGEAEEAAKPIIEKMYDKDGNFRQNGFIPLQKISYNRKISNQEHVKELETILNNQGEYYPCIKENKEKILALCKFYIPFYVGPLRQDMMPKGKQWIVYKETDDRTKIMPWTIEERIDLEKTAENYIQSLTNHCTFYKDEYVLPKHSLLYEQFMMLEEINCLRIRYDNDKHIESKENSPEKIIVPIPKEIKEKIINQLFYRGKKNEAVTISKILGLIKEEYSSKKNLELVYRSWETATGSMHTKMTATREILSIMGGDISEVNGHKEELETIIRWATIYKDPSIMMRLIKKEFGTRFHEHQIERLSRLRYKGWGRFSRRLLEGTPCICNGEKKTVIQIMRDTHACLMQVYHIPKYGNLKAEIAKQIKEPSLHTLCYDTVRELPGSPALKRGIWTAMRVLQEIEAVMKCEPTGVYIRNQRESNKSKAAEKTHAKTRYTYIKKLYKSYETKNKEKIDPLLYTELESCKTEMTDTQYLYFTQMGKCMYSGNRISLNDLGTYITESIIPLALMDDKTLDNKILVKDHVVQRAAGEAIPEQVIAKMMDYWLTLYSNAFITENKLNRLMKSKYNDEDFHYFLKKQWTETSLIVERLTNVLRDYYQTREITANREREETEQEIDKDRKRAGCENKEDKRAQDKHTHTHVYGINEKLINQLRNSVGANHVKNLNDAGQAYNAFLTAHIGCFVDRYLINSISDESSKDRKDLFKAEKKGYLDKNGIIVELYSNTQADEAEYHPGESEKVQPIISESGNKIYEKDIKKRITQKAQEAAETNKAISPSIWKSAEERKKYIKDVYYWHDLFATYMPREFCGQFYHARIYRPGKNVNISLKDGLDPSVYGGKMNAKTAYMVVVSYEEGNKTYKEIINVPAYIAARRKNDPQALMNYIRDGLMINENSNQHNVRIVRDHVKLHQKVLLDGHPYYLMSASELMTAKQLYISREYMQAVWTITTMSPNKETVEAYLETGYLDLETIDGLLEYLMDKLEFYYPIYPRLMKNIQDNKNKIRQLETNNKIRMIKVLLNAMNGKAIRIKPMMKDIEKDVEETQPELELKLEGDNRLNNRRIREEKLILLNESITGMRCKKILL